MEIDLKLTAIRGVLSRNSFLIGDDEPIKVTPINLKSPIVYLLVNDKSFYIENGKFTIYGRDLNETNTITLVEINDNCQRRYAVDNLIVFKPTASSELVESEVAYYQNQIVTMRQTVEKLEEFKTKATEDIIALTKAMNTLLEEFKTVKEEMAI